ncbi:hypothetical protein ACS0TY_007219 [Phlomoides rotata]
MTDLPIDELIEKADGFTGVFPEHKYEIVKCLQTRKHICGMTGDGVNDAPALKKADIGIVVADATDAARSASDIVLTEPGLSVIISAVLTSRAIFQRMKNYTVQLFCVSFYVQSHHEYNLFGTIVHAGFSPNSGHYYANIKDAFGRWYCCNDSYVSVSTLEEVLLEKSYILFISRTKQRPRTKFDVVANGSKSHESNGNKTSIMQQTGCRDTKQVSNHLQEFNKSTNGTRSLFHKSSCLEKQVNMKITDKSF